MIITKRKQDSDLHAVEWCELKRRIKADLICEGLVGCLFRASTRKWVNLYIKELISMEVFNGACIYLKKLQDMYLYYSTL